VAAPTKKKRLYETDAQIRCRKKKGNKNLERQEKKAAGLKINSLDDVETFEEEDPDDRAIVRIRWHALPWSWICGGFTIGGSEMRV
jgi:hypothetical protein